MKVTPEDIGAMSVSVSAWFAVMVMVPARGVWMSTLVAAVVMVKTPACAASTTARLASLVTVTAVPFGALIRSDIWPAAVITTLGCV